jgi:hypothetical protein
VCNDIQGQGSSADGFWGSDHDGGEGRGWSGHRLVFDKNRLVTETTPSQFSDFGKTIPVAVSQWLKSKWQQRFSDSGQFNFLWQKIPKVALR